MHYAYAVALLAEAVIGLHYDNRMYTVALIEISTQVCVPGVILATCPEPCIFGYLYRAFIFFIFFGKRKTFPGANMARNVFGAYGGVELIVRGVTQRASVTKR